jgi:hypothetical protein
MATQTPNYDFNLPAVNSPTDEDLWGTELNANWSSIDTLLKAVSDAANAAGRLPVGSIYTNYDDNTNPASLLGYGTWVAVGQGRVLIGVGTGTDANGTMETFAEGDTGGEYTHTLTTAEIPTLTGTVPARSAFGPVSGSGGPVASSFSPDTTLPVTISTGAGAHINKQPYLAVYMWRRSA